MKAFIFEPNGHGQNHFITIAENEEIAVERMKKHVKDNYFKNNKYAYEAQGFETDHYTLVTVSNGEVYEIE